MARLPQNGKPANVPQKYCNVGAAFCVKEVFL
jgi:hypothetical protein